MPTDLQSLLDDPKALAAVAGGVVLLLILVIAVAKGGKRRARARAAAARRKEQRRLEVTLENMKQEMARALAEARPVFDLVEKEGAFKDPVGHWRREKKHRLHVRVPDMEAVKELARSLGHDAAPIIDLAAALRKERRHIADYDSGRLDASPTPIATVKELEKGIEKLELLTSMALSRIRSS